MAGVNRRLMEGGEHVVSRSRPLGAVMRPAGAAALALAILMELYTHAAGTMALQRHHNLKAQALDMGYADQVTWSMTQGR